MVKSTVITLIVLAAFSPSLAQKGGLNIADHLLIREAKWIVEGKPDANYEGSPYLNDEFRNASVYTADIKFNAVPMRYNIASDVMEYQVNNTLYELDADPKLVKVEIGEVTFVVLNSGFYQLKLEGKLSVVARHVISVRPKNDLTGIPAKYSRQADVYYLVLPDLRLEKVSSVKNLLAFIPDLKPEVAEFVKREKLSTRTIRDVLKIAGHYNSLSAAQKP